MALRSADVSDTDRLKSLIVPPRVAHTHTMILLHGRGSTGKAFGEALLLTAASSTGHSLPEMLPGTKFIFPTAKLRRSSNPMHATLYQWFDMLSPKDPSPRTDLEIPGLAEEAAYIRSVIDEEIRSIPVSRVFLGGFSQGGAMGLIALLTMDHALGGFIGMSGWLPLTKEIQSCIQESGPTNDNFTFEVDHGYPDMLCRAVNLVRKHLSLDELEHASPSCLQIPCFLGHGEEDRQVPCTLGESACETLSSLGMDLTTRSYPDLGHWYKIPDEIDDILDFLEIKAGLFLEDRADC